VNFTGSMQQALWWEVAVLAVVFFLTFMLPRRPRTEAELAEAEKEGSGPVAAF
jgi:hypothetical protein